MEKVVTTLTELEEGAARFVAELMPRAGSATLVTLSGELGAGKTAFVQAVARTLGIHEAVTSPTFVIEKIYQLPDAGHQVSSGHLVSAQAGFSRLIHIDAYRLESGSDLAAIGFDELMRDSGNLVLLEWPEKVVDALPTPAERISIVVAMDESRHISYGQER